MPSRRGQAVYKRNVRRIRTICENAEHFLASFFQLSGGASPSLTGYARILQHALEMPKWELPKKFPFWHGLNVKGELPSPLHNPPMRVYALPHKFVYSLIFDERLSGGTFPPSGRGGPSQSRRLAIPGAGRAGQ